MKKKIQIIVMLIVILLNLQVCSYSMATGSGRPGNTNSVSSGSQNGGATTGSGSYGNANSVNFGSQNGGSSTGSGSYGNSNTLVTGSGSHGNTNTAINNRPSTGIDLNGKASQTMVPSGSVNPDTYEPKELTTSDAGEFMNIANSIIGALQIFGTVVAVIALMALGVKYMLGSTQEKADYKETMIPYLIGAVMVFAIPGILRVLFDIVTQIKF